MVEKEEGEFTPPEPRIVLQGQPESIAAPQTSASVSQTQTSSAPPADPLNGQATRLPPPAASAIPLQMPAPVPQAQKKSRTALWVTLGVAIFALAVVGAVFAAISLGKGLASTIAKSVEFPQVYPDQEPVLGEPGPLIARTPLDCPESCFTGASVGKFVPNLSAIGELGDFSTTEPYGYYEALNVADAFDGLVEQWKDGQGSPDKCFFASTFAPTATSLTAGELHPADQIYFLGTHEDDYSEILSFSVRLFETSKSAEGYLEGLGRAVAQCDEYALAFQGETDPYSVKVSPVPDLGLPASMAGSGWIERDANGLGGYYYVVTLQRGNLVAQIALLSDSTITEMDFRRFINGYAALLASVQP